MLTIDIWLVTTEQGLLFPKKRRLLATCRSPFYSDENGFLAGLLDY